MAPGRRRLSIRRVNSHLTLFGVQPAGLALKSQRKFLRASQACHGPPGVLPPLDARDVRRLGMLKEFREQFEFGARHRTMA